MSRPSVRQGFLGYKEKCSDIGGLVIRSTAANLRKYIMTNNLNNLEARGSNPRFLPAMSSKVRGSFISHFRGEHVLCTIRRLNGRRLMAMVGYGFCRRIS
jgi:hypothetical protein